MTIREALRRRWEAMILGGVMVPMWLYSAPLNNTFRVGAIGLADIAVLVLFIAGFKCPRCHAGFWNACREVLYGMASCACTHCGVSVDERHRPGTGVKLER